MTIQKPSIRVARTMGPLTLANESRPLSADEQAEIRAEAEGLIARLFETLRIDAEHDHNMTGSARRIAKMLVSELFVGRYTARPQVTTFPNVRALDEIYTVGPVAVRSTCSHHFAPVMGKAWIGLIPDAKLIGLSKLSRLTDWIMRRPQLQEEATCQLADELESILSPKGLAVIVTARHMCLEWRGVCEHATEMTTSVMRGLFRESAEARADLMSLIRG